MEKIKSSAIKIKDKVYTGKRHCDCFKSIFDAGDEHFNDIQGFITEEGRFVGRWEAREIALSAGQIEDGKTIDKNILYSEDLY